MCQSSWVSNADFIVSVCALGFIAFQSYFIRVQSNANLENSQSQLSSLEEQKKAISAQKVQYLIPAILQLSELAIVKFAEVFSQEVEERALIDFATREKKNPIVVEFANRSLIPIEKIILSVEDESIIEALKVNKYVAQIISLCQILQSE